ncbi:MAG: RidA family protein [Alphaproteobacteria bacterium]|nr:RidA family protein [Alphaproteobacteria bacterium]
MAGTVDARLKELGIDIPTPPTPAANYVPFVKSGNLVFVSGQIPMVAGKIEGIGTVGEDYSVDEAKDIARICAINLIAQAKVAAGGDLDRVQRVVKLGGFVNCVDHFIEQPEVINGASDLMVAVFGDKGRHARFAVGSNSLPRGVAVEVEGVFEIA